jgi:4-hydroxybutyrate CoA-transferase
MFMELERAMERIKPGGNLFIQTGAAAPQQLILGLMKRAGELKDITIYQMHTEGEAPYADPAWEGVFLPQKE